MFAFFAWVTHKGRFCSALGELHAATLTAATCVHLRLNYDDWGAERLCSALCFFGRSGELSFRDRYAELPKEPLRLILMNVQLSLLGLGTTA